MLLISHKEHNMIKPGRENINVYKKLEQKKPTKTSSRKWEKGSKYQKKVIDKVT
jgi:hypothetical protein